MQKDFGAPKLLRKWNIIGPKMPHISFRFN